MRKITPSEEQTQKSYVEWCRVTSLPSEYGKGKIGDYLFHAPSQGARTKKFGAKLKQMGWCAGFPDVAIFLPSFGFNVFGFRFYTALFIEFKSDEGKVEKAQAEWLGKLSSGGQFVCFVVRDVDKAIEVTKQYFGMHLREAFEKSMNTEEFKKAFKEASKAERKAKLLTTQREIK